ncbi:cupin domain-containing protein [Candidatus Albibeggiatoa sp. nov. BB20]|uniref:cupin domain-containing protein n=1 Tax=Candidatus Albibeggiatoa sp. nov. BB20 TaxID=3162723 RepID=UPI0033657DB1
MLKTISLSQFSPSEFLQHYWQKKPLLIRQAIPNFSSPITPDELAGLACEPDVESRLIREQDGDKSWTLRYGPFSEDDFSQLPETHWTLLVQEANKQVPEIEDILDLFNFVPSWRVDDLMISYAVPQGSVGAHTDSYDVFLLQAHGLRRWQISLQNGELLPDLELKILKEFSPEESWILEPGDMLYLPPNTAHHGVALDECMTFSIGFLAPTHNEMIQDFVDYSLNELDAEKRYADPELQLPKNTGEISGEALQKIQRIIQNLSTDSRSVNQWFGCFISESRAGTSYEQPEPAYDKKEWLNIFQHESQLRRIAKLLFINESEGMTLFIEGRAIPISKSCQAAIPILSSQREFSYPELQAYLDNDELVDLLVDFTNLGFIYFYDEDEPADQG